MVSALDSFFVSIQLRSRPSVLSCHLWSDLPGGGRCVVVMRRFLSWLHPGYLPLWPLSTLPALFSTVLFNCQWKYQHLPAFITDSCHCINLPGLFVLLSERSPYSLSACCLPQRETPLPSPFSLSSLNLLNLNLNLKRQSLLIYYIQHLFITKTAKNSAD